MIEKVGNQSGNRRWSTEAPRCSTMIGFSKDWPPLHHPAHVATRKIIVGSSHLGPAWLEYIKTRSEEYIRDILERECCEPDAPIIVFILGSFGKFDFLRHPDSMLELLDDTLEALESYSKAIPVVLKPHAITDRKVLTEAISRRTRGRFIISDAHPMVLATRARLFVGNYFSLTFGDARHYGVPTVEYTDYSPETMVLTEGGSMWSSLVTHFVNRDPILFRKVLADLIDGSPPNLHQPIGNPDIKKLAEIFEA